MNSTELALRFKECFGSEPAIVTAPGRVNLIGEHTDYNDGFVMPAAIDLSVHIAIAAHADRRLVLQSAQFPGDFTFNIDDLPSKKVGEWCDYVLGIALALRQPGHALRGANLMVDGTIPSGGGLSSSAALEVASAIALLTINEGELDLSNTGLISVAKLCQESENHFIGARVGIMDPFVSCLGKAGHALFLDCRSLAFEYVPLPDAVKLVVCNTMVKHAHASGEYNRRRQECEEGVRILRKHDSSIRALRDVKVDQLVKHSREMPRKIFSRCRHVIEENLRVCDAVRCLRSGDLRGFGNLMRESHRSLRDLYEVSCRELDILVEAADALTGVYGSRMTGGGFGGCTINLVQVSEAGNFVDQITDRYRQATGIQPSVYTCSPGDGVKVALP
jgi:galactokinase